MNENIPKWALLPFDRMSEYIQEISLMMQLNASAVEMLILTPKLLAFITKLRVQPPDEVWEKLREQARGTGDDLQDLIPLARTQKDKGYDYACSHALVDVWGSLERLVEDLLVAWLDNFQGVAQIDKVSKVRISLAEFQSLDPEDRSKYVLQEIGKDVRASFKSGIGQFEELLNIFGLGGPVDDGTKRGILELQQIRNVIVHQRSTADKRFCERCPWLEMKPGQKVEITINSLHKYAPTVNTYAKILFSRVASKF